MKEKFVFLFKKLHFYAIKEQTHPFINKQHVSHLHKNGTFALMSFLQKSQISNLFQSPKISLSFSINF